jgi:hypothetical protein
VPERRRRVPVVVASSATLETSDVTSVVSLNGFLPSIRPGCPDRTGRWPGGLGTPVPRQRATGVFTQPAYRGAVMPGQDG